MHLRKLIAVGAAVLTAGLISLAPTSQASTPGGPIAGVEVNGSRAAGTPAVNGIFKSGTATFAGVTVGCLGGSVAGTVDRGPNTAPKFVFSSLNLTCDSPIGDDATITLVNNASCRINVNMVDNEVHDELASGVIDSGAVKTNKIADVTGSASIPVVAAPTGPCLRVTVLGGCTFHVLGSMGVNFDEARKTVGGVTYQDLILKGNALTTQSPNFFCFGLISNGGTITLNNIRFNMQVTGGTTGRGIDFYN